MSTMFNCDCCPRRFNSQHAVNQHMDALGHRVPRFNCETCDRAFFAQHSANQHMNDTGHWRPQVKGNSGASFSSDQAWHKQGWVGENISGQSTSSGGLWGNGQQSTHGGGLYSSFRASSDQGSPSSLFGQGSSSGSLFGQQSSGGLFGQSTPRQGLFGQGPSSPQTLFGGQNPSTQGFSSGQGVSGGQNPIANQSLFGQSSSSGLRFSCETCNMEFYSQNDADLHREGFGHKKPSIIDDIEVVTNSYAYKDEIVKLFDNGWRHPTRTASIQCIYVHTQRAQELVAYLNSGEARVLFHGTQRACHVGDLNYALRVCNDIERHLCSILRDGFKLDRASKYNGT